MIHLLWCTLRVSMFKNSHKIWCDNSNSEFKTHVLVSTDGEKKELEKYFDSVNREYEIMVFKPPYTGVCLPSYKLSTSYDFKDDDIIIFGSDDFLPPKNWTEYLENKLGNKDGLLFVRDGYQKPDSSNMLYPAITIPIMTGSALRKMNNVIYHPSYCHMFSDCELYLNAKDLGILIDDRLNDETTFKHYHYASGNRGADQFDKSYHLGWKKDEDNWNKRKNISVEKRLVVNA